MTFKIFLLCVVLVCCISIGIKISKHYAIRERFYKDLCDYFKEYKLKVSYSKQKILEIIDTSRNYGKEFSHFLMEYKRYITCEIDETLLTKCNSLYFLNVEERKEVVDMFLSLGTMSKEEEMEKSRAGEIINSEKYNKCKIEKSKFSSLYVKLFIILALFIFIIFI